MKRLLLGVENKSIIICCYTTRSNNNCCRSHTTSNTLLSVNFAKEKQSRDSHFKPITKNHFNYSNAL